MLVLVVTQTISTPLVLLLTAMPAQENAEFSKSQGVDLLVFGCMALVIRNLLLLGLFYYQNRDMIARLSKLGQLRVNNNNPEQEKRAWEQATSAVKNALVDEFAGLIIVALLPILVYGHFKLLLTFEQLVYLSLATLSAGLTVLLLGHLSVDRLFEPVMLVIVPRQFTIQLEGLKGMRLWVKLLIVVIGVAIIGLFLTIPAAYQQARLIFSSGSRSPQALINALLVIMKAGAGALVVGVLLSIQFIFYFSRPFNRMIKLFSEVEKGDLNQRIHVSLPDEFGVLNVYINHMINRIQTLTFSLEQQVAERTLQLSRTNDQLQVELSERRRIEEQLAYSALHDPLTDLPNRVLFVDRLKHAMARAKRHPAYTFAVFFLDLDRFKIVNDSLGHNIGDLLLVESARRLTASVRGEDSVARLGGDEFVILLEEMKEKDDYLTVAGRILNNLALPANLSGQTAFISVSLGIVFSDDRYERPEDILRDADLAMYHAKKQGRGCYAIFDSSMLDSAMARLELETDLRKALDEQELMVYYQPILNLETRRIVGFEALLRWQHPRQGLLMPAEFIPIAEEIGLIVPIGYWVIDQACRQIRLWQEQYPAEPPLTVNVNLSTKQCTQADLIPKISEILQNNHLDASSLKLELTESLIVEDSEFVSMILVKLRELGIQVQIDDFGTEYSSLGYLHVLPIDMLKIDRVFIKQLGTNSSGREIVQTILSLAHSLGMKVIAEGVETDDQLSRLKAMDCEYVQGFLFSKPVDSQKAQELLEKSFI